MRRSSYILILLLYCLTTEGQTPVGSWSDHLNYSTVKNIAVGTDDVYATSGSSIMVYNKEFAELKKLTRINGLTETEISKIAWSEEYKTLVIAYSSSNVDLLNNNIVYNIPDINRKYIPGKKEINRIRISGKFAYMACSFGIVVLDLNKKEVYDTWNPGNGDDNAEVFDLTLAGDKIFAATSIGVFSADLINSGLSYFGNWNRINSLPSTGGGFTSIIYSGNNLYTNYADPISGGDVVYVTDIISNVFLNFPGIYNTSFDQASDGFTIANKNLVKYFNKDGTELKTITSYGWGTPNISQAVADNGDIWIADIGSGLIRGENMSVFTAFTLPGPVSNNAFYITSHNGKTMICGGGVINSWNNLNYPLQISIVENNKWSNIYSSLAKDAMRAVPDPDNNNHFFVSSWGGGLLEYSDNELLKQYTESNSPLQTIIAGAAYVRICGMAFDRDKNLWITQTEVPGSIKALKPDGSWIVNPISIDAPTIGDIIITKNGYKWVVLPRGYGLFVLDDNNTPENFTDDRSKIMLVEDIENKVISGVYTIAEDLDGNIWTGTDQGPLIYYNPEKVFDDDLKAYRIKIPRNDGSGLADYTLSTETITSIAVDGGNRKWLGTLSSGAYNLSPDGVTLLKHFNEENSPLLSNSIVSLAVDNKTGDVWFGTSKGVQSFRGDAVEGEEIFSKVYTFPNPVREDFEGNVTITGLIRDSEIKITDISGNLVYETVSDGGQASWDLKTYNGKRVSTGVYLVFCSGSNGSQSCVTKMLVIR